MGQAFNNMLYESKLCTEGDLLMNAATRAENLKIQNKQKSKFGS